MPSVEKKPITTIVLGIILFVGFCYYSTQVGNLREDLQSKTEQTQYDTQHLRELKACSDYLFTNQIPALDSDVGIECRVMWRVDGFAPYPTQSIQL